MNVIPSRCGHIIADTEKQQLLFTSTDAAVGGIETLIILCEALISDMSKILQIPVEQIIEDYYNDKECDIMTAAYNAVVRKYYPNALEKLPKSITQQSIDVVLEKLKIGNE